MAKMIVCKAKSTLLDLQDPEAGLYPVNHILEPEFHQYDYVSVCEKIKSEAGSFQLGSFEGLVGSIRRGVQPKYADEEGDEESLIWNGMIKRDGSVVDDVDANICAIKSVCVRAGYVDLDNARSVDASFYEKVKTRAGVRKNDILVNSTGDGTIGRVAVYNYDFPAVVDGHISIVRLDDPSMAWYVGAFLMSDLGQKQISRYVNGSSGQVEIYPQDLARIWVRYASQQVVFNISEKFKKTCESYSRFQRDLKTILNFEL